MTPSEPYFEMPVFAGIFLEEETTLAFRQAFAEFSARPETTISALRFQFYLPDARGSRCISEKSALYVRPKEPGAQANDPRTSAAWNAVCAAWCADRLGEQSVLAMPLPWNSPDFGPRLSGRLLSLFWHPAFIILAQEYIPTFLEDDNLDPIGPGRPLSHRVALASLILPEIQSHHDSFANENRFNKGKNDLAAVWHEMTNELDDPLELRVNVSHPMKL